MALIAIVAVALLFLANRSTSTTSDQNQPAMPIPPDPAPPWTPPSTEFDGTTVTNTSNISQGVLDFAQAIARAEGFGLPGAIPTRANNPGDLVIPGWTGATLGGERISVFESPDAGWQALYHQLMLIVLGKSHVYTIDMSIYDMAAKWTHTQSDAWAANVLSYLVNNGYDWLVPDSGIGEVLLS